MSPLWGCPRGSVRFMETGYMTPALFDERYAIQHPYAADHLPSPVYKYERGEALRKRYLQATQNLVWVIIIDIDHEGALESWQDAGLPEPAWAVGDLFGTGHLAWLLKVPVCKTNLAKEKPLRFLARIEQGLVETLEADRSYTGLLTKNPLHFTWDTLWGTDHAYTLGELAQALGDRLPRQLKRKPENSTSLSRNCTMFRKLRAQAYAAWSRYQQDGYEEFYATVAAHAYLINQRFPEALPESEVRSTVKSVATWTWQHFSADGLARWHSCKGRSGGKASGKTRRGDRVDRLRKAIDDETI